MAYMDIPPGTEPNGKTVVLFHGKAFGGYYFQNVIEARSPGMADRCLKRNVIMYSMLSCTDRQ